MITRLCFSLNFILLTILSGCSSHQKKAPTPKVEKRSETEPKKIAKPKTFSLIQSGQSSLFKDRSKRYGLAGLKAKTLNVISLKSHSVDLVLLPDFYSAPQFYRQDKITKKFKPLGYSPFDSRLRFSWLNFVDLNDDGVLDALGGVINTDQALKQQPLRLFWGKREKGRVYFHDSEIHHFLNVKSANGVSVIDLNGDGRLDLYIPSWFYWNKRKQKISPDYLFLNTEKGFKNISSLLGREQEWDGDSRSFPYAQPTFGSSTCDINNDGKPDILTVAHNGYANKLWLNLSNSDQVSLNEIGKSSGYASDHRGRLLLKGGGNSAFSACADYNNDGKIDIFLGEIYHALDGKNVDRSSMLTGLNQYGPIKFKRTVFTPDLPREANQGDRRGIWADLDFDGYVDLLVENFGYPPHSRLIFFRQDLEGGFEDKAKDFGINLLNPTGTVLIDVNSDGRLDLLTSSSSIRNENIKEKLFLFENNIPFDKKRVLRLLLKSRSENSRGIGATLKITSNIDTRRIHYEFSQGGVPSQNQEGLNIGLREGERISSIRVSWPLKGKGETWLRTSHKIRLSNSPYQEWTLCDSGKSKIGNKDCR